MLRLAQYAIDLPGGDATKGGKIATSSPLALAMSFRGLARWCLGITGWRNDFEQAVQMVKTAEAVTRGGVLYYTHTMSMLHGVLGPNDAILHEMTEILSSAEQTGEDVAFGLAKSNVAFALLHRDGESREYGLELLRQIRDIAMRQRYSRTAIPMIDVFVAQDRALRGDLDGAIELSRAVVKEEIDERRRNIRPDSDQCACRGVAETRYRRRYPGSPVGGRPVEDGGDRTRDRAVRHLDAETAHTDRAGKGRRRNIPATSRSIPKDGCRPRL